jgi:hypothetical protein
MADYDLKIYGIEVGIGGSSDVDIFRKSMFKLIHSEFSNSSLSREEINTFNFKLSLISEDSVSKGEIEPT